MVDLCNHGGRDKFTESSILLLLSILVIETRLLFSNLAFFAFSFTIHLHINTSPTSPRSSISTQIFYSSQASNGLYWGIPPRRSLYLACKLYCTSEHLCTSLVSRILSVVIFGSEKLRTEFVRYCRVLWSQVPEGYDPLWLLYAFRKNDISYFSKYLVVIFASKLNKGDIRSEVIY